MTHTNELISAPAVQSPGLQNRLAGQCCLTITSQLMDQGLPFHKAALVAAKADEAFRMVLEDRPGEDLHLIAWPVGRKVKFELIEKPCAAAARIDEHRRSGHAVIAVNLCDILRETVALYLEVTGDGSRTEKCH